MKIISLQSFLVYEIPPHMKDLCLNLSLTPSEEDSDDTSETEAESLLLDEESVESHDLPKEGRSRDTLSTFEKKHLKKMTAARLPPLWSKDLGCVMREMTYRWVQSQQEHVLQSAVRKETWSFLKARFVGYLSCLTNFGQIQLA